MQDPTELYAQWLAIENKQKILFRLAFILQKDIEALVPWEVYFTEDLIIVEGAFDAIKAGSNAIPLLGSQLSERSVLFQKIVKHGPKVYLALDPDAEKKSTNLIKKLLTYGITLCKVEIMPYSDVGEMSREEFLTRKSQAKPVGDLFQYLLERAVKIWSLHTSLTHTLEI